MSFPFETAHIQIRDGKAIVAGLDQPAATIVDLNHHQLVIKIPGHQRWAAIGERAYEPSQIQVFEILDVNTDLQRLVVKPLADYTASGKLNAIEAQAALLACALKRGKS